LKKYGAALFKNAVYVLPYTKEYEEIILWLCKHIKDSGSDASLFITESLDKKQDEEIVKTFNDACDKEYLVLSNACDNILKTVEQIEGTEGITDSLTHDVKKRLNETIKNVEDLAKIDFFNAPQKERVSQKVQVIQQKLDGWSKATKRKVCGIDKTYQAKDYVGKKWVTRRDVYIDRMASAWLIRRFIDTKARFIFLPKSTDKTPKGAIPFDMYGAEFTHHGDDCTFETLIKAFGLKDAALAPIAEIVHDIDLKDDKYGRKEAEGLSQIVTGLSQKLKNDNKLLEKGAEIFDALYQYYSSNTAGGN